MGPTNLKKLLTTLKQQRPTTPINYAVPDLWNAFGYDGAEMKTLRSDELLVNPFDFYAHIIDRVILPRAKKGIDPSKALSQNTKRRNGGDWVKKSFMYSTMIRTSSAWDHDRDEALSLDNLSNLKETGTFVKMLGLLPTLVKMGIDTLYLLPISKHSTKIKKGDFGSPYAVQHFTELDPNLKDPMTGDAMSIDEEFAALVESCHLLGIRVIIDIIPRTHAIDNDLIRKHPEWFYWVKADAPYTTPRVDSLDETAYPAPDTMPTVFADHAIKRHLARFEFDPKTTDAEKWNAIKRRRNLLDAIEETFNLTVAPAFSDFINDIQPPWSDVTFFRLYLDHPKETRQYLEDPEAQPPYMLYDTIKSNLYPGEKPNMALWKTIADVIPSFQRRFGIDGARIDMGHALPKALLDMIIDKARAIDPDFAFIAEELDPKLASDAKAKGYNMIIGNGFIMTPRIYTGQARNFYHGLKDLPLPAFACSETHDTPRIASRDGGEAGATTLTVLNMFTPNGVPFLNAGQEVYERQPMNLGLDASEADLYHLPEDDPYYKKLALFDKVALHYTHPRRWHIPDILEHVSQIRARYVTAIMTKSQNVVFENENPLFVGFGFIRKTKDIEKNILLVLANLNPDYDAQHTIDIEALRRKANNHRARGELLFSTNEPPRPFTQFLSDTTLDIHLGKGEVKIVEI